VRPIPVLLRTACGAERAVTNIHAESTEFGCSIGPPGTCAMRVFKDTGIESTCGTMRVFEEVVEPPPRVYWPDFAIGTASGGWIKLHFTDPDGPVFARTPRERHDLARQMIETAYHQFLVTPPPEESDSVLGAAAPFMVMPS